MDLLDSTLKFFPNNAFNIETHDFSVIAKQHNPNEHFLHIPYSITWNQEYLVALQELLIKFEVEGVIPFVNFDEGKIYIDYTLMRKLKQTFNGNDKVLLNINSLHTDISINSCVQSIRDKPGEVHGSVKSLYTHPSRGIDIKSNNTVNSFILFPINENDLEEFEGTTEVTLSVSSVNNCPENS
jgi:hypothetical protein